MRTKSRLRSKGFTLPEILVSITLVAILAAVVVPTITGQIKKGDQARIGEEFAAIRGGAEQFLSDIRKYPASIGQLSHLIVVTASPLPGTSLSTYGQADVNRWRGPYLTKDSIAASATGFNLNATTKFDTVSLAISGTSSAAGQKYMVLSIGMSTGNDSLTALDIDRQFDDGALLTGSIRYRKCAVAQPTACTTPATDKDTLKYLIMPIY